MQWTGRPGLWDDWLAFQAEAARARREEAARIELEDYQRRENIDQVVKITGLVVLAAGVIVGLIILVGVVVPYI